MAEVKNPRRMLEDLLEKLWKSPEFEKIRDAYEGAAGSKHVENSYGACLKALMDEGRAGRDAYRECAEKYGLGKAYASAWGR